jgi:hypothetical protein
VLLLAGWAAVLAGAGAAVLVAAGAAAAGAVAAGVGAGGWAALPLSLLLLQAATASRVAHRKGKRFSMANLLKGKRQ